MSTYNISINTTVSITDSKPLGIYNKVVSNGMTISGSLSTSKRMNEVINTTASISSNVLVTKYISIRITEGLTIDDDTLTSAKFLEKIVQGSEITAFVNLYNKSNDPEDEDSVISTSGDTFVINYESNALSKYTNFTFNSFAKINGKYYGANESGLYELGTEANENMETDNIECKLITGFTDVSGFGVNSNVYDMELYIKNDGGMSIRVLASDNKSYIYKLSKRNENVASSRVKMGKGRDAVFWQFELTNEQGTDFELNNIKLCKLIKSRIT